MSGELLAYRPWRGTFRPPGWSVWPIARLALLMIFRRKLFWALYALALFIFFLYFFGQYMLFWAESMMDQGSIPFFGRNVSPRQLTQPLRQGALKLNGQGEMYLNFFWYQGYSLMMVLALAGSILVGNDVRHGSLPFYLSKPLTPSHYLAGKCLAVTVFVNMVTTLPALALFVQFGVLDESDYFTEQPHLILGIVGYGMILSVVLSLVLVALAVGLRKTVPMIMAWTTLFFFFRRLADALVIRLNYDPRWRLIDLWNDLFVVGSACMDTRTLTYGAQPEVWEAGLVLAAVSLLCLTYVVRRIRAVEVIS